MPSVSADDADAVQVEKENLYTISFFIRPGGGYVGMDPELASLQLKRLPGVKDIQASGEFSGQLEENACLSCIVEDEGVVSLRQMRGLRMTNEVARCQ